MPAVAQRRKCRIDSGVGMMEETKVDFKVRSEFKGIKGWINKKWLMFILSIKKVYFRKIYTQEYLEKEIPKITAKHDSGEEIMSGFGKLVYMKAQLDSGYGTFKRIGTGEKQDEKKQ